MNVLASIGLILFLLVSISDYQHRQEYVNADKKDAEILATLDEAWKHIDNPEEVHFIIKDMGEPLNNYSYVWADMSALYLGLYVKESNRTKAFKQKAKTYSSSLCSALNKLLEHIEIKDDGLLIELMGETYTRTTFDTFGGCVPDNVLEYKTLIEQHRDELLLYYLSHTYFNYRKTKDIIAELSHIKDKVRQKKLIIALLTNYRYDLFYNYTKEVEKLLDDALLLSPLREDKYLDEYTAMVLQEIRFSHGKDRETHGLLVTKEIEDKFHSVYKMFGAEYPLIKEIQPYIRHYFLREATLKKHQKQLLFEKKLCFIDDKDRFSTYTKEYSLYVNNKLILKSQATEKGYIRHRFDASFSDRNVTIKYGDNVIQTYIDWHQRINIIEEEERLAVDVREEPKAERYLLMLGALGFDVLKEPRKMVKRFQQEYGTNDFAFEGYLGKKTRKYIASDFHAYYRRTYQREKYWIVDQEAYLTNGR